MISNRNTAGLMLRFEDAGNHCGTAIVTVSRFDGLNDLDRNAPLWPVSPGAWHAIVAEVRRLADRWHHAAVSQGWTIEELYPLHAVSPFNRLDQMDAFWIAARRGHQVTAVDHVAITLKTRSGATLRIYRHAPQSRP